MPPAVRRPIELEPGTQLAAAVTRGSTAFAQADAVRGDTEYRHAVRIAADRRLWSALAADHIAGLLRLRAYTRALQRCAEYVDEAGENHLALRLLQTECRSSLADHSGVDADVAAIRTALRNRPDSPDTDYSFTIDDEARLARVAGLSAADRSDADLAAQELGRARELFLKAGNQAGVQAVDVDELLLAVLRGDEAAIDCALSEGRLKTAADRLLFAGALKQRLRYEAALNALQTIIDDGVELALRFPVLWERAVLLRLIRNAAEQLVPSLREAAAAAPDPVACDGAIARLSRNGEPNDAVSPVFNRRIQQARWLIISGRLDEAKSLLDELRPQARTDRDIAAWNLAAGELELTKGKLVEERSFVQDAVHREAARYLGAAVAHASTPALLDVRVDGLRLLGRSYAQLRGLRRHGRHDRVKC